jgi:hypothetical protein
MKYTSKQMRIIFKNFFMKYFENDLHHKVKLDVKIISLLFTLVFLLVEKTKVRS